MLLKPYFVTSFALLIVFTLAGHGNPLGLLLDIFYGNGAIVRWGAMWFLTHLFALFCFAYVVYRLTDLQHRPALMQWGIVAVLLLAGSYWSTAFWDLEITIADKQHFIHGLPFNSDILLLSGVYFMAGSFLRQRVIGFTPQPLLMLIAVIGFLAIVLFTDAAIDFNRRVYAQPLFATIGAACGIYGVLVIAWCLNRIPVVREIILAYGRASLFILIFHVYFSGLAFKALTKYGPFAADNVLVLTAAFIASITIPVLIRRLVVRVPALSVLYLPLNARQTEVLQRRFRLRHSRAASDQHDDR